MWYVRGSVLPCLWLVTVECWRSTLENPSNTNNRYRYLIPCDLLACIDQFVYMKNTRLFNIFYISFFFLLINIDSQIFKYAAAGTTARSCLETRIRHQSFELCPNPFMWNPKHSYSRGWNIFPHLWEYLHSVFCVPYV